MQLTLMSQPGPAPAEQQSRGRGSRPSVISHRRCDAGAFIMGSYPREEREDTEPQRRGSMYG